MTNPSTQPVSLKHARLVPVEEGLERQVLAFTPHVMLVRHLLKAGWKGARHSHPHDQLVYVVGGRLQFICGDTSFEVGPGDSFVVPGQVEHQAAALEDAEVLDVFVPFREDYAASSAEN